MQHTLPVLLLALLSAVLMTACTPEAAVPEILPEETISSPAPQPESTQPTEPEIEYTPEPEADPEPEPIWQITLNEEIAELYEETCSQETGIQTIRRYVFSTGETVEMGKLEGTGGSVELASCTVGAGTLHRFDADTGIWTEVELAAGVYTGNWLALTLEDGGSALFYLPKLYRIQASNSREYLPGLDGALEVTADGTDWRIAMTVTLPEEAVTAEYLLVRWDDSLFDETAPDCWQSWEVCLLENTGMWCMDGFYRATPEDYMPSGENYFYRCAASYMVRQAVEIAEAGQPGGKALSIAMLDTVAQQQNLYGFWETGPQSGWLFRDYGLDGGFYDTRFNTDLAALLVRVYQNWGGNRFLEVLERYGDFFLSYAEDHHFETASGWFVADYYHPDGGQLTHTSLNHQAAECTLLYDMATLLDRPELAALADTMVNAIRDTGLSWVMEDHDLYYCIYPDGTFGRDDYPYLTYNDLLTLQQALEIRTGLRDDVISAIMEEKKIWMDQNHVTGYRTE